MKHYTANWIHSNLDFPTLIKALRDGFRREYLVPDRMHINYDSGGEENTLLLMPAIATERVMGVKVVNVAPDNARLSLPSIQGIYYLANARTGVPIATFDARAITNWRTAAASALASSYLSRSNASRLLMIGTGGLAPFLIDAHAAIRPMESLTVYGRDYRKAEQLAASKKQSFSESLATEDLAVAAAEADIISVATLSENPLIHGDWLKPGQHIDLVGSFKPNMREADDQVIKKSRIFMDSRSTASKESGDLAIPLKNGIIDESDLLGDLFGLCQGKVEGRQSEKEITLFKSVGHALEDLVAAQVITRQNQ